MTRLTRRNPDGAANFADAEFESVCAELTPKNREEVRAIVDALADWEDARAEGRLLTLPVKIGSVVYFLLNGKTEAVTVTYVFVSDKHAYMNLQLNENRNYHVSVRRFGKDVFLTRAEAEAALKGGGV